MSRLRGQDKLQPQQRHFRHRQEHFSAAGQQDKSEFIVEGNRIINIIGSLLDIIGSYRLIFYIIFLYLLHE
jgi:hypothetical protein